MQYLAGHNAVIRHKIPRGPCHTLCNWLSLVGAVSQSLQPKFHWSKLWKGFPVAVGPPMGLRISMAGDELGKQ